MAYESPRGILVAGGATSQLLGVALQLYFLSQGILLEIFFVETKLSHTQGFIFQNTIPAKSIQGSGRIEKYLPKSLLRYQYSIRRIYALFGKVVRALTIKKKVGLEKNLVLRVNNRNETVSTWNTETGLINGGIWPGIIGVTAHELQEFFSKLSLPNPFAHSEKSQVNIAIHYRLGDMRTDPYWRKTHGVLDPLVILKEVEKILENTGNTIPKFVYSDEPEIAKLLLESAGMFDCVYVDPSDIWTDLRRMSNSSYFIGSFSTVSMVAAEIRTTQDLFSNQLPLNCRKHRLTQRLSNTKYFEAKILPLRHWVYKISSDSDFNS